MCGPSCRHNWWLAHHHLKRGGLCFQMLRIVVAKLGQFQMVHPILLIHYNIIPYELLNNQVHSLGFSICLGLEWSAHLELNPMRFHRAHQNLLMNFGSQSDTMSFGRPWCLNTYVKNNLLVSWAVALSFVGMKCVILLYRLTTTMIASNPFDVSSPWNPWTHFHTAF